LDADSEGEEGKYYVWEKSELEKIIPLDKQEVFFQAYGVTKEGNFEHSTNHLYVSDEELVRKHRAEFKDILESLRSIRKKRIPPSLDNKILTSWSSLMVRGFYSANRILQDPEIRKIAHIVVESIFKRLFSGEDKILYRVLDTTSGQHKILGHLDDYAYFIQALFEDFQYYPTQDTFLLIKNLIEIVQEQFWDEENKGYYYSSSLNSDVIKRLKTGSDMPLPNPSAVMAENLLQYHFYAGDTTDLSSLKQAEQALLPYVETAWYLLGSMDIIITDEKKSEEEVINFIHNNYLPRLHLWIKREVFPELIAFTSKFSFNSKYSLYFCKNFNCLPPTKDWDVFNKQISENLISLSKKS
jgi:uncharacterized protein YyaL (SSP411 family)